MILSDRLHLSGSLTMTKCCTLSEYANTHHPEAVASALTEQLSIVIVYNFDFKKKSDVRLKCNSHLLPPTSSGPDSDSPPSPTALLPCTPPPFPLILPITSPVCAPGGDHTVHLCALTMFLQRAEADVEVFGLFFRSGPSATERSRRIEG